MWNARGFVSVYLIAGVAFALLAGGVAIQTKRLSVANEDLGAERVAKAQAMAAIARHAQMAKAAEAALLARDTIAAELRKIRQGQRVRLTEIAKNDPESKNWLDVPVPAAVRLLIDNRRSGKPSATSAASDASKGDTDATTKPGHQ